MHYCLLELAALWIFWNYYPQYDVIAQHLCDVYESTVFLVVIFIVENTGILVAILEY
jgi:hypothetical protein